MLQLIGYWDGPDALGGLPDVCDFLPANVDAGLSRILAAYLRSGAVYVVAAGVSTCRLCGRPNGNAELTDGEHFVWPEGLAHYVEEHAVLLPDEVIAVAKRGSTHSANPDRFEDGLLATGEASIDAGWWLSLARTTDHRAATGRGTPHLLGCRRNPAVASWNLPAEADIYVDRIPPASITVLAWIRRLLGLAWPLSGLRDLLTTQPFLAVQDGDPAKVRRALISAPELRAHLYYRTSDGLMPVWTEK